MTAGTATTRLTIGQLAASARVSRKAIRVWVEKGLLAACDHTPSGYQLFAPETVDLAVFIRRARALGLSLAQIHDIIQARHEDTTAPCADVRRLLHARIADINATVADLLTLRTTLQTACAAQPNTDAEAAVCPIIEQPVDQSSLACG